jgi:brefeldin A-resistance guanine nucleotide exchange factor 1
MRRIPADLKEIGLDAFLRPFLDVIRSEVTTGPITGVALNSVRKFITYGLIGALVCGASHASEPWPLPARHCGVRAER